MPIDQKALDSLRIDRSANYAAPARASWQRYGWAGAVALLAMLLTGLYFWRTSAPQVATVAAQSAGGDVQAAVLNASGYVVARRLATVSAKVTAKVVEVLVEEGVTVRQGQLLARLDDGTARAQYDLANAELRSTQQNLDEVRVRFAEAQRQWRRVESLKQQGLVSEATLDAAQSEAAALQARLVALEGAVAVADSRRRLRSRDLEDLVVRAPFDGVVTSKDAQPGEMISPVSAGGGFTRTGIATIVDMDSREIEVDVNEAYINRVRAQQRVEAVLDAYPGWAIPAEVINIVPTADRQKATVRVRIAFDALDPRIVPDMGVKVRFLDEPAAGARATAVVARIPANAIARDGDKDVVWVVRGDRVERRAIRISAGEGETRDVLAGVAPGEMLVIDPPAVLADGIRVKVREATQ
jgi:RND family efflux transporter MFP subunit